MIKRIHIENFRSIKNLELNPNNLCALVGENNVGKSNILAAIDLLLGEKWPANKITEDDLYNYDKNLDVSIRIFFDECIEYSYYGNALEINGFGLEYNSNNGTTLYCLDENGDSIITQYGKELRLNNDIRNSIPCVFVKINRNLEKELAGSQWTLFGKLLKNIEDKFTDDECRMYKYEKIMGELNNLLRIDSFNTLEEIIETQVRKMTGYGDANLKFVEPQILAHYRNLDIKLKESPDFGDFSALTMGAGIQSSIVIALIQAYKELMKKGAILLIEEPEVYLHPHARRHFYSVMKELSKEGHQLFYTTHSTEFIDVLNYSTICIVRKTAQNGTRINDVQHLELTSKERLKLKLITEFNADKNELFFARKVLLVEGLTERLSLPHIFALKQIYPDLNAISIIDAGAKENIKFFIKILKAFSIPFVVLHDEDSETNNYTTYHAGSDGLNAVIENAVGNPGLVFRMDPDFEGVFELPCGQYKISNAIENAKNMHVGNIPKVVNDAIEKLMAI